MIEVEKNIVFLMITNQCYNNCLHCNPKSTRKNPNVLTGNSIIKGIDNLRKWSNFENIAISGGDPLLHPDFEEIYSYAYINYAVTLFTTGLSLSDEKKEYLKKNPPKQLITSLYGLEKSHDLFCRKNNAFKSVIRLVEFFNVLSSDIIVNIIVHKNNVFQLKDIIKYLHEKKINGIKLISFSPSGRGSVNKGLVLNNSEYLNYLKELEEFIHNEHIHFDKGIKIQRHISIEKANNVKNCSVLNDNQNCFTSSIHIDEYGDIYPCVLLLKRDNFKLGNILNNEIELSGYYESIKNEKLKLQKRCNNCKLSHYCVGGCTGYHIINGFDHRCNYLGYNLGCPTFYTYLL